MADATVPLPAPALRTFGRFAIERELGRGGMGIVYKAIDPKLQRAVALKVLIGEEIVAGTDRVKRFLREAHAVAKLRHPNVVQIYELGEVGKQHYFTMEYVEGGSLDGKLFAALGGTKQPPRAHPETTASPMALELSKVETSGPYNLYDALTLIRDIARGLGCAHAQRIIHRDVKPANVLLDRKGTPYLTDFGLAKDVGDFGKSVLTLTGTLMGTPAYMSPEQAAGRTSEVGAASDVWALGAMSYELLTLRCPFGGESLADIFHEIAKKNPPPPSAAMKRGRPSSGAAPRLPSQVDEVVMRCLEKEPARRYADGNALADDIDRYLAGGETEAGAPLALQRERITEKRKQSVMMRREMGRRQAVVTAGVVIAALVTAAGIWGIANRRSAAAAAHEQAIRAASKYVQDREWKKAVNYIDERLVDYSDDAALIAQRKEAEEALAKLHAAVAKADRAFDAKDFVAAKAAYKDALLLDPLDERTNTRYQEVDSILYRLDQALAKGDRLLKDGDAEGALAAYNAAIDLCPKSQHALTGSEEAKKLLAPTPPPAVTAPPAPPPVPDAAVELYQKALRRTEETRAAWQSALALLDKALQVAPGYGPAWYERGRLHDKLGQRDEALWDFERAIRVDSFVVQSRFARGCILFDEFCAAVPARAEFEVVSKGATDPVFELAAKARVALADGDFARAIDLARQVVQRAPGFPDAHCVMGKAYALQPNPDLGKSLECLNSAIALDPTLWATWASRSRVHWLRKEYDQGLADANKAVEMSSAALAALRWRGWNLGGLQRFEEAVRQYDAVEKQAAASSPYLWRDRGDFQEAWAMALKHAGKAHDARQHLQSAIMDWESFAKVAPPSADREDVETKLTTARLTLESWR